MPQSVIDAMQKQLGLGAWNFTLRFYGHPEINEIGSRIVKEAIAKHADVEFRETRWQRGETVSRDSGAGVPSVTCSILPGCGRPPSPIPGRRARARLAGW